MKKVSIIGAGAWGTALAIACSNTGSSVTLWSRHQDHSDAINNQKRNDRYLPGIDIPDAISATSNLIAASQNDLIFIVVPAQHLREIVTQMGAAITDSSVLVLCSKGFEQSTGMLLSQVVDDISRDTITAILSGPNFAREVALGKPSATTLAADNQEIADKIIAAVGQPTFRPYLSSDKVGAQIGGAVKNVLAIASGIVAGADLGENARAALITRGMAEILRLGDKLGARAETLTGLSGFGDLVLSCGSEQSRNFSLGSALGRGEALNDILAARQSVTEGVYTAAALRKMASRLQIDMPLCAAVDDIVNNGVGVETAIQKLLARPFRDEKLAGF
jgi:glycerol-3-phosphate dehydrogenase (NAD(P)+)